jgi:[acyl-carrier-protein] S-malonyltransferase
VGQSLGEVSALVVAGALDEAEALRFVRLRATLPAELLPPRTWTMASMTRLRPDRAAAAADGLDVWTVGRNGPSDAVVVAADGAFDVFADRLGAKPHTYRLLPVTAPYHTPLMAPVAAALADVVAGFAVRDPAVPVLTPTGPGEVRTAAEVRALLVAMLTSPVDWTGVLALGAARWPSAHWRECGPSCSLHRFVVKNDLALDWGEA